MGLENMTGIFTGPLGEAAKKVSLLQEEINKTVNQISTDDLQDASLKLLTRHSDIEAVRWTQYTPYFNDGDACTFGVHEPYIKFKTLDLANKYSAYGVEDEDPDEDGNGYCYMGWSSWGEETSLHDDFEEFSDFVQANENLMKQLFGDHAIIKITREGINAEEYDHD
jgi:hypothetical protein